MEVDIEKQSMGSFTAGFHFSNGVPYFEGFTMETLVSKSLGLKYRVLLKHPTDGKFWTMKGLEVPMSQIEIRKILDEKHKGFLAAKEFAFEVFANSGKEKLFATKFNAEDKIPADGYDSNKLVATSFTWSFELPEELRLQAKKAVEEFLRN